jgi:hypothetical protein
MYKLNQHSITRLADGASIPLANGNRDYEEYKQWLSEGNTPEPEFTEAELEAKELQTKLNEALTYLTSTDWITAKYNDVVTVLGTMSKDDFVSKYKETYDNRTAARAVAGAE